MNKTWLIMAAWPRAVKQGIVRDFDKMNPGQLRLPDVLRKDEGRRVFHLSLGHCLEVSWGPTGSQRTKIGKNRKIQIAE